MLRVELFSSSRALFSLCFDMILLYTPHFFIVSVVVFFSPHISLGFSIVQIKSGRSLFVHLLFRCTLVYDFIFVFGFCLICSNLRLICVFPSLFAVGLECLLHRLHFVHIHMANNDATVEFLKRMHVFFKSMSDLELS